MVGSNSNSNSNDEITNNISVQNLRDKLGNIIRDATDNNLAVEFSLYKSQGRQGMVYINERGETIYKKPGSTWEAYMHMRAYKNKLLKPYTTQPLLLRVNKKHTNNNKNNYRYYQPFIEGWTAKHILENPDPFTTSFLSKVLDNLKELEEVFETCKIAHNDIHDENIIIQNSAGIKIIDWGEAGMKKMENDENSNNSQKDVNDLVDFVINPIQEIMNKRMKKRKRLQESE